ncbi:S8 family serine peptidase [bacterium]|nr:S8 family serine peptidase [bacterium]
MLHDLDQDGWCDIWCSLFKSEAKHRSKSVDTDGDGLTDYEEMVIMRNPLTAEPFPKNFSDADRALARKEAQVQFVKSQEKWQKLLKEKPRLQKMIDPADRANDPRITRLNEKIEKLKREAVELRLKAPLRKIRLEDKAKELGIPMAEMMPEGHVRSFRGAIGGVPIYTRSNNRLAAASISADELWAPNIAPWASGSTGLDLDGSNVTIAQFENDGGVNVDHLAFGGRITQRDNANLDTGGHATQVAGTLAGFSNTDPEITGVAFASDIEAFSISDLAEKRAGAAAGLPPQGGQILTLSNNSWSTVQGWEIQNFGGAPRWFFHGAAEATAGREEDQKYGRYINDTSGFIDFDCVEIDEFVASSAPHHLLIYSAGNDTSTGPQNNLMTVSFTTFNSTTGQDQVVTQNTGVYFARADNGQLVQRNAAAVPKDFITGDEGGYDTINIPGTSKNLLTVGACLDVISGPNDPGFSTGTPVTIADFSGAGPCDDGRIKPDLVAVGAISPNRDEITGVSVTDGLNTANDDSNTDTVDNATGTSFSAPAVTGGLALVLQRHEQLYPSTDMYLASTLKAIAINGCDDPGAPGPDFKRGHGLFNAASSVLLVDEDFSAGRGSQIKEFDLSPTESVEWLVEVDSSNPLSITAAWTDPAGAGQGLVGTPDIQTRALVNNIDIKMENVETGQILLPWVLDPDLDNETQAVREQAAQQGVDSINNVERISLSVPTSGIYKVTVTHSGGIAGNAAPSLQTVSVVSTNAMPLIPVIEDIQVSPAKDSFILSYLSDPGAYYDVETSTTLQAGSWSKIGEAFATSVDNSVTVTLTAGAGAPKRFLRLKRSQ